MVEKTRSKQASCNAEGQEPAEIVSMCRHQKIEICAEKRGNPKRILQLMSKLTETATEENEVVPTDEV
jgi:hypothetical protein